MPSSPAGTAARQSYRSLFLSDLHLGARSSRPDVVLSFLNRVEAETIYLVGDILDIWHGGELHWTQTHEAVVADLKRRALCGTKVVYLPGNHDARMRAPEAKAAPWELREVVVHIAANGQRYLVLHGDQCDPRFLRWHVMTRLGSRLDGFLRQVDTWMSESLGLGARGKTPVQRLFALANSVLAMGDRFERRLTSLARATGTTGVICGHSHKPALRDRDGVTFANCGDWVDSLTALAEDRDGELRLIDFAAEAARAPARPGRTAAKDKGALAGGMA